MPLTHKSKWHSFGGTLSVHEHESAVTQTPMTFAVYTPPTTDAHNGPFPVLWYLSGLTCTWANVMEKAGLQGWAAELGLMIIAPDTSPRGDIVANVESYDLGQGAGFYLSATQEPWAEHYQMDRYITEDLTPIIADNFNADMSRQGITGHSMGGHGAITLHLKNQDQFKSCSAFAPITSPSQVPWGEKAFKAYLGDNKADWAAYDAAALIKAGHKSQAHILIDTGTADNFRAEQLKPEIFKDACKSTGQRLTSRLQEGYDHSYYFVASFAEEHLRWHAEILKKTA
jgi:S-formylglutathione hydrolase